MNSRFFIIETGNMDACLILLILAIAAIAVVAGYAQDNKGVEIKDFTLELKGDGNLSVDIDIDLTNLDVKTTQVVVLTPVIVNGDNSQELKSIAVYGRNRRIYYLRNEDLRPTTSEDVELTRRESRDIINYSTSLYFADWMDGCSVRLLRTDYGCCGRWYFPDGGNHQSSTIL